MWEVFRLSVCGTGRHNSPPFKCYALQRDAQVVTGFSTETSRFAREKQTSGTKLTSFLTGQILDMPAKEWEEVVGSWREGRRKRKLSWSKFMAKLLGKVFQLKKNEYTVGWAIGGRELRPRKSDSRSYSKCFISSDLSIFIYKMEKIKPIYVHYVQMICLYPFVFLPTHISIISKLVELTTLSILLTFLIQKPKLFSNT